MQVSIDANFLEFLDKLISTTCVSLSINTCGFENDAVREKYVPSLKSPRFSFPIIFLFVKYVSRFVSMIMLHKPRKFDMRFTRTPV